MNRRALCHVAGAAFWVALAFDHITALVQPLGHWLEAPLLAFDLLGLTLSVALFRRALRQPSEDAS